MSDALKKCPFCGKNAVMFVRDEIPRKFYVACIEMCGYQQYDSPKIAQNKWNERASIKKILISKDDPKL